MLDSARVFAADDWPQTRAERSAYRETSRYTDVMEFLDRLVAKGAPVAVRMIGTSANGRELPLAVAARPMVASAAEARRAGKVVVYIQANIHAGEVEGKEAALMLLRDLAGQPDDLLLDRLVVLVSPIYNIDGNEALGPGATKRGSQDGPDLVGDRASGEGLDLNRDGMKAQARETRAVLQHVFNAWDPDVMLDLHTTNGTRHGFHLTYSPPLHPATDASVLRYARDDLLPAVRERLKREQGLRLFDYGNVEMRGGARGWYTFGWEGRYVTNYAGLRGRVAVLSEAASFLPFRTRVETTLAFVRAVLEQLARDTDRVRALTRAADSRRIDPKASPETIGVRFQPESRGTEPVPLEVVASGEKVDRHKAPQRLADVDLPIYDRFRATRTAPIPAAYLVPAELTDVVALLRRHGAAVERLNEEWRGEAEAFAIDELVVSTSRFQGGRLTRLEGRFEVHATVQPLGSFLVRTAQPLGTLIAVLLEPESLDGVAAWGFLDGKLAEKMPYPILKSESPIRAKTERVP
jgi:hypothetical protein